jgi:4-amino-4-deoxy-L-arabinose transferase-like glycosyltransferase
MLALQVWLIFNMQLFGDEAFYWLEAQYLNWSYAEVPGWNPWMIRLGTEIFGSHYFSLRLFSYLSFIGLFYAAFLLAKEFDVKFKNTLIILSVPLLILIATMALPDIWLLFFVLWLSYFFVKSVKYNNNKDWLVLGVLLALSINVHVRMWIWLFFAGMAFIVLYYKESRVLKPAMMLALPVGLLGLLPILYFNYNHDFALFVFQFGRRHPWEFQLSNLNFTLSQFIVITPIVLFVWFKGIIQIKKQSRVVRWILLTALLHALFYFITSLFADGLRTTVHWLLISYIPVLILVSYLLPKNERLLNFAMISGGVFSLLLLLILTFDGKEPSTIQARILDNSLGWKKLSKEVDKNLKDLKINNLVADYFMTAAELAFELNMPDEIKVLPHEKSIKHGRQKQLEIMGLLLENPSSYREKSLLVIEDSTLKLKNKGKYYAQLCSYFPQMNHIETVNIEQSNKQFHLFKINDKGECDIPPFFYINSEVDELELIVSGWVILNRIGIQSLWFVSQDEIEIVNFRDKNEGIEQQFPEIDDPNSPNNGFEIKVNRKSIKDKQFRLKAIGENGRDYFSPTYYIN